MASILLPIFSTLALFFIMAVDMADSHSHYCAGVPPIDAYFYDYDDYCYVQEMFERNGDVLTSCANFTVDENPNEISGSLTLEGIDANGKFRQKKLFWEEIDDNFQLINNSDRNPVAQVKAYKKSGANEVVQSVVLNNDDGYIMVTCPFSEQTQQPGELQEMIVCTWLQNTEKARVDKLLYEAKRLGINTDHVKSVHQKYC